MLVPVLPLTRSYKIIQYMGSNLRESYRLERLVPCVGSNKFRVNKSIGYLGWYEDEGLWSLYEHIRRYREEGGAVIQHGEEVRKRHAGRVYPVLSQ